MGWKLTTGGFSTHYCVHKETGWPERMSVPCGQCIGCRIDQARAWAVRITHEASLHNENCFLTLTYDDAHLPSGGTLVKRDFQLFMKRFRKRISPVKIRYFQCGEYGEKLSRPHYHAIIFGYDFPDKILWRETKGNRLYISESLAELWDYGFHTIGPATLETAAYVARYVTKKINGEPASDHYLSVCHRTGECHPVIPEYVTMSRRPGIAREWYEQFKNDVHPSDFVIINGRRFRPPRYYDRLLKAADPEQFELVRQGREIRAKEHADDNTPERLAVRQECARRKLETQQTRKYENGEIQDVHGI